MYLKKLAVISCFNCNFTHTFMPSSLQYFELVQTFNILRVPAFKLCVLTSRAKVVQKWKGYKFVILCHRERFIMFGTCRTHFSSVTLWIVYCIPNSPKCTRYTYILYCRPRPTTRTDFGIGMAVRWNPIINSMFSPH